MHFLCFIFCKSYLYWNDVLTDKTNLKSLIQFKKNNNLVYCAQIYIQSSF